MAAVLFTISFRTCYLSDVVLLDKINLKGLIKSKCLRRLQALASLTCAAPTRDGSLVDFSLLNVRHSEPTSTTLNNIHDALRNVTTRNVVIGTV